MTRHQPIHAETWYADAIRQLESVRDEAELRSAAGLLDGFEFQELAEDQQTHLSLLYSEAYFRTTGALTP